MARGGRVAGIAAAIALTLLAGATPAMAGSAPDAPGQPTLTLLSADSASPRLIAGKMPHKSTGAKDDAGIQVICYVGGDGPRRTNSQTIYFGISAHCDGQIKRVTTYQYILYQISSEGWSGFAARGPDSSSANLHIIGLSRTDPVCLPASYIGVLDVTVEFLSGEPRVIQSIFATNSVFIGC